MACDPVNCARGNLLIFKEDLTFRGFFGEERWFRRYDSVLDYDGAFGKGWLHTFESFVYAEPDNRTLTEKEEETIQDYSKYRVTAMLPDTHKEIFVYREGEWTTKKEGGPYKFYVKAEGGFLLEERIEGKYTAYHYDKKGRLVALQSHPGCAPTRIFYVENGDDIPAFTYSTIDRVEYPGGQSLHFTYKDRLITSVTDHMGRKVVYHYADGRLTHVTYPTGGCQEYEYEKAGHISVLKGEDGREFIRNEYDRKGRVTAQHYPDGTSCNITYADQERKTIFKYSDSGREEINYYNDKEEVVKREFGDGICEIMEYDSYGNKISVTDRNGNTTTYKYDKQGLLTEKCTPKGLLTTYVYDEAGMLTEESDNTGAHKWYEYNKAHNLVKETQFLGGREYGSISYTRDEYGRMLTVTDALGNTTAYDYEENIDRPTEVTTAEGCLYRYCYDKAGRRIKIITDYGMKEISYSETDAVSMETDALGNHTRYYLDAVGNVLKTIKPNNYDEETDNGEGTYYEYDYLDRLVLTKYPDGSTKKSVLDMDGNVLSENILPVLPENAESRATQYSYDNRRYRISEKAPDGGITWFEHDRNGNLLKTIRPEEYAKSGRNGAGISYTYDEENHLTGICDDKGNPFRRFVYDEKGRLIKSTEGTASCGTKYVYDPAGRLTEKWVPVREVNNTDGANKIDDANNTDDANKIDDANNTNDANNTDDTEKSKTEDNRLCTVLYNVTLYTYDAAGNRILERRSPDEVAEGKRPAHYLDIRMSYDKQNRLVRVEDSLGAAAEYTYDCLNNRLTEKYRVNESSYRLICYKYDAAGRLIERMESVDLADVGRKESPYRKKEFLRTKFVYDKNGNIIKTILPNGGEVNRKYDIMDRVILENIRDEKSGINKTTHYAYDAAGKLTSRTDDYGNVHTYTYDTCGRLLLETDEEGGTTRYFHNKNNELIKAVNADNYDSKKDDGAGYTFTYDIFGRMKEVRDAYGNLCESDVYDEAGRIKRRHDSVGLIFRNEYDTGGRKTSIYIEENGNPVQTYTYDSLGNITGTTDGEANHTSFELDAWGRIVSIQMPDGSHESYTYDHAGNITTTTDGNGNTITYTYNSMMNLSRVTDQAGNADTFTYDGEGNMAGHTDRNGKEIRSEYGSFGILLSEHATDGTFHTRKYDTQGRLIENASNHVTYRYDYTKTGRLRTKYINGKAALTYTYTKAGKVASITDISGKTTTYAYDPNGNLIKVSEAGKALATYAYDATGCIQKIRFANGITTNYTYDTERNLASLETTDKEGKRLISYTYQYDRNGNRTEKKDHVKESHVTTYAYDSMQRLSEVTYPQAGTESYIYDAVGNRIEKRVERSVEYTAENPVQGDITDYTERYTYDARNRLTAKSVWENGNEKPSDTTTYTYDAQGSLLSEKSMDICKKYLYNDLHQCIRTEVVKGREEEAERAVLENIYDGEGLRYSVIENGRRTDFVTNGWENLAELDENEVVKKRLIRGNGIVASEEYEEYGYFHGNERMDTMYITDGNGTVQNHYEYDAFGNITFKEERIRNRYTYSGEAYDSISEQYYLRKRFYNPKLCRFIQEDEYRGDGLNLYAFCANNPVMYVDPSGYKSKKCATDSDSETEVIMPSKPHTNGTQGHWETILDEVNIMKNSGDYSKIYVNKGLSNEIPGAKPNRRPDIMGVRNDGFIDQVEVPSKTDIPDVLTDRMIDNQRIIGGRAGNIKIRNIGGN